MAETSLASRRLAEHFDAYQFDALDRRDYELSDAVASVDNERVTVFQEQVGQDNPQFSAIVGVDGSEVAQNSHRRQR